MRLLLEVITCPPDELATRLLAERPADPEVTVERLDLTGEAPDYRKLLERVFAADAVVTW